MRATLTGFLISPKLPRELVNFPFSRVREYHDQFNTEKPPLMLHVSCTFSSDTSSTLAVVYTTADFICSCKHGGAAKTRKSQFDGIVGADVRVLFLWCLVPQSLVSGQTVQKRCNYRKSDRFFCCS